MAKLMEDKTIRVVVNKKTEDFPYGPTFTFYIDDKLIVPKKFKCIKNNKKQVVFEFGNPPNQTDFLED